MTESINVPDAPHGRVGVWFVAVLTQQKTRCTPRARRGLARKHWLHQISHHVTSVKRPAVIVLEDLNVAGMVRNRHLAKALSEASFGELRRQVEYKAEALGIEVIHADRWFPSSKTCSGCGCIKDDLTLSDRVYECEHCGLVIDRDWNAAKNLAALAKVQTAPGCVGS